MKRDLLRRLERLEDQLESKTCPVVYGIPHPDDEPGFSTLAPGERIVHDIYRIRGCWGDARARITADPNDQGRKCDRGGYLEDVIRELHATCEQRDQGECGTCAGLSHLFTEQDPEPT